MKSLPVAGLALVLAVVPGCASIASLTECPEPYGGTRLDIRAAGENGDKAIVVPFAILDLPFSAVLDTILLPVTVPWWLATRDS